VLTGTELLTVDEAVERIEAVTADDVGELARTHWRPDGLSAAAIGPSGEVIRAAVGRLAPELARAS
jgi:predicted Zn-dependent peptidase